LSANQFLRKNKHFLTHPKCHQLLGLEICS
jgi:hypothetical protein